VRDARRAAEVDRAVEGRGAAEKFAIGMVTTIRVLSGCVSEMSAENVVFTIVGEASRLSARAVPCTLPLSVNRIDWSVPSVGLNFGMLSEVIQIVLWSGTESVKQIVFVVCAEAAPPRVRAASNARVEREEAIVQILR
jgi:hypothetical protein